MDHIITTAIFLSVLRTALCFNIDPVAWKSWSKTAAGFGYKVMQRQSDLIVSAPLEQFSQNRRGRIYQCNDRDCQPLQGNVPGFNNMTLGLSMTSNPNNMNPLVCGPTIPKDCRSITLYSGACFEITSSGWNTIMPFPLPECRVEADIAFLLDGSGSVINTDFIKMKTFVKQMIKSFLSQDTKFAIVQFSDLIRPHYTFGNSYTFQQWEYNIDRINQITGGTHTAGAIRYVVEDIFKQSAGARENVKKILIVVTDGESQDGSKLQDSVNLAEQKKIIRFAIGVGRAFTNFNAKKELKTIASYPSSEHVFQVENFDALDKIRQNLQDKIFSIEGSQSGGASLKLEMAQEGFSAAYGPEGFQIGIIGANQWRGGYMKYTTRGGMWSSYDPDNIETDSYMGYSITVATTSRGPLTIVGAPRYKHRGAVMTVHGRDTSQKIDPFPWQFQSGEYFGAEVCAMDVNGDKITDVILISAPMYKETDREGRVYVCRLTGWNVDCRFDSPLVLRGTASDRARFGSAIAVLPDINTDRLSDLAIGAPLENEGQGSIYIFNGEGGGEGINPTYSQRIAGSAVQAGLKFFGQSISQLSFDHSRDTLPDLAVGSKGTVVLLRSQPIVMVEAVISFIPAQIPTQNPDCTKPLNSSAKVCFAMTKHSSVQTARANITFSLTLDATRKVPKNRAYISKTEREMTRSVIVDLTGPKCSNVNFFIESCPEDALNELNNELKFTFKGLPSAENLKPSLAQQAQTTTFHPIGFEINCGTDNKCVDNLKVDLNFTRSSEVKVGIDELVNVTVSVENSEENSYNSRVILTYPAGLSYRKFTSKLGRIDCNSVDSEDGLSRGKTDCTINKPIFKTNAQAVFIVSYGIDTKRELERHIFVTANATSGNQQHSSSSQLYKMQSIIVKYSIFVTIESSFSYNNFTFGKNDLQKPVEQTIVVSNDIRALNLTVVIKVPVKLGDKDIWVDPNNLIQGSNCQRGQDENPTVREFIAKIQEKKVVDCSVATCSVFRCSHFMGRLENKKYEISANISSGWLEQIGLSSAKYLVTSTASLEYDTNQYIFYSTGSNNNPPIHKIEAVVEVYTERSFTKEIIGGSLGGLALLALLTAGLYKAGFFKSKYNQMMNEQGGEGGNEGDAASPEE